MSHRIPNDVDRINVHSNEEVAYWCRELGCDADTLREAVSAVGVEVANVREHLRQAA